MRPPMDKPMATQLHQQKRRPNPKKPKKPKRLRNTWAKTPAKPKNQQKKTKSSMKSGCPGQMLHSVEISSFLGFLGLAGVFAYVFRRRLGFFDFFGFGRLFLLTYVGISPSAPIRYGNQFVRPNRDGQWEQRTRSPTDIGRHVRRMGCIL